MKWFLIATLAIAFTACGGGGGDNPTAQETAQAKIVAYADSNGTNGKPPSVQDYTDAGVTGVTESNKDTMNELVKNSTAEGIDTLAKVQALADGLGAPDNTAPSITTTATTTATEDTEYSYTPTATDVEGGTITWSISGEPAGMTISSTTGEVTWTPTEGVTTSGEVTITATDDGTPALTDTQKLTISVNAVNDAPVATADSNTTDEDTPLSIAVLANDTDTENDTLSIKAGSITTPSQGGTAVINGTNIDYTPATDFYGTETFDYTVSDGTVDGNTVTVTVTVNSVVDNAPKLVEPTYLTSFTYSGDANWTEDNTTYYSATGSWKNEDINDSQSACMEASVDESEDTSMAFAYKVSSESCCDKLKFYIDGSEQNQYIDNQWTTATHSIASGTHTLKWCYSKDSSSSSGDDTAWIDDIKVGEMHYTLAEDRALGQIGSIGIVPQDDANISSFTIDGNGSEKFSVALDGRLSLIAKLDYETQRAYTLSITAHNGAGASNTVTRTIAVTDIDDLYITNAFFDNNGTAGDSGDDRLLLQYSKTLDESSIDSPVSTNFVINLNGTVDTGDSTAEYNASKSYYHHILSLVGANTLLEQNISIATDTLTASGAETQDSTKTLIRATAGSRVVKKTGQTKSYDENGEKVVPISSIKDDGYYQSGVAPRYSRDDVKEVVVDHVTGLSWQDDTAVTSNEQNWTDAIIYCNDLNTTANSGYDDWRLPTIDELVYITDKGKYNPAIDNSPTAFQNTNSSSYWTATTNASNTSRAWVVDFNYGSGSNGGKGFSGYVRCVRAGQP